MDRSQTRILATHECFSRLREGVVGRLAVITDGHPDIFPVNYIVDQGTVLFRTSAGNKLAGALGQSVAFEVDGYETASASAWSVVVKGVGREVREVDDVIELMRSELDPWEDGSKPRFLRIEPTAISGRVIPVRHGSTATSPATSGAASVAAVPQETTR